MKFVLAVILSVALCVHPVYAMEIRGPILYTDVQETTESPKEESIIVSAPSAILMEASTGQVIYEKDADTQRPPASVTKVMTLLLIFDALEEGKISLEDEVIRKATFEDVRNAIETLSDIQKRRIKN